MNNTIRLRGVITHVTLRPTSLFMTVREEARSGNHGMQHTVKAFYPKESPEPAEMWARRLQHYERGMTVIVEGKLTSEQERQQDPVSKEYVPVRHPTQDRDLYSHYIWAIQIDALFDPALHSKRSSHPDPQTAQRQPNAAAQPPAPRPQARAAVPAAADDDLPPLPGSDVAWN